MSLDGNTSTTGAASDAQPLQLSQDGEDFVSSIGSNLAAGAADAAPDIGASLAQGALDQLTQTVRPYLPFILLGFAALLLIRR